jgi:hypothetical protein
MNAPEPPALEDADPVTAWHAGRNYERATAAYELERLRDKIDRLCLRIEDAELALNHWDAGHVSEYWLRYRNAVAVAAA